MMDDDHFYNHGWAGVYTKRDVWICRIMAAIVVLIIIGAIVLGYLANAAAIEYDKKYCNGSPECRHMMSRAPVRVYVENGCVVNGRIVESRQQ